MSFILHPFRHASVYHVLTKNTVIPYSSYVVDVKTINNVQDSDQILFNIPATVAGRYVDMAASTMSGSVRMVNRDGSLIDDPNVDCAPIKYWSRALFGSYDCFVAGTQVC